MEFRVKIDFLIVAFLALLAYKFTPDEALDLYRYYQGIIEIPLSTGIVTFIKDTIASRFDFIYFLSLFIIRKIHLSLHLVNAFYVGFFYFQVINILNWGIKKHVVKNFKIILLFKFLVTSAVPFVFVFSISRMVAALAFFFWGINYLIRGNKLKFLLLCFIALFTHVGMIIYIFLFVLIYFVIQPCLKKFNPQIILLIGLPVSFLLLKTSDFFIEKLLSLSFFSIYSYYKNYLSLNLISFSGQSRITSIHTLLYVIFIFFALILLRKYDKLTMVTIYLFLFLFMCIFIDNMFFQRTILFMCPFYGLTFLQCYKYNTVNRNSLVFLMTITTIVISILIYIAFFLKGFFPLY